MIARQYPDADHVKIDLQGKTIYARCTTNPDKDIISALGSESEYTDTLAHIYGIKDLREIVVDLKTQQVQFIGDITKTI
jgi:hypothetical protein